MHLLWMHCLLCLLRSHLWLHPFLVQQRGKGGLVWDTPPLALTFVCEISLGIFQWGWQCCTSCNWFLMRHWLIHCTSLFAFNMLIRHKGKRIWDWVIHGCQTGMQTAWYQPGFCQFEILVGGELRGIFYEIWPYWRNRSLLRVFYGTQRDTEG